MRFVVRDLPNLTKPYPINENHIENSPVVTAEVDRIRAVDSELQGDKTDVYFYGPSIGENYETNVYGDTCGAL